MSVMILQVVTRYGLVDKYKRFEEHTASIFRARTYMKNPHGLIYRKTTSIYPPSQNL
jgi:hypothetical protein